MEYEQPPPKPLAPVDGARAPPVVEFRETKSSLHYAIMIVSLTIAVMFALSMAYSVVLAYRTVQFVGRLSCREIMTPLNEKTCYAFPGVSWNGQAIDGERFGELQYLWHLSLDEFRETHGQWWCEGQ